MFTDQDSTAVLTEEQYYFRLTNGYPILPLQPTNLSTKAGETVRDRLLAWQKVEYEYQRVFIADDHLGKYKETIPEDAPDTVWESRRTPPNPGCTETQIQRVEQMIGEPLPLDAKEFVALNFPVRYEGPYTQVFIGKIAGWQNANDATLEILLSKGGVDLQKAIQLNYDPDGHAMVFLAKVLPITPDYETETKKGFWKIMTCEDDDTIYGKGFEKVGKFDSISEFIAHQTRCVRKIIDDYVAQP